MTIEEFEILKEFGKRKKEVDGKSINVNELQYTFVKGIFLFLINNGQIIESVQQALDYLEIDHKKLSSVDMISIFLHLYDEILTEKGIIFQLENTYLKSTPDPLMIASGSQSLAPFNTHLTLMELSKEMNTPIGELEEKSFQYLFDYQVAKFKQSQVQKNYNELLMKKK